MKTDIRVLLPTDVIDALYGANSPSASNPFVTSSDLTSALVWKKITKSYTDFATGAASNTINLYQPAAREVIHMVVMNPDTAFNSGGTTAMASYTISVDHYAPADLLPASNVFTLAIYPYSATNTIVSENMGPSVITATATTTGDVLSGATQGDATFWILTSLLP